MIRNGVCRQSLSIQDRSRYQLDYRHPLVRKFATEVIDRVVNEYRIGYIKMDYNIEPGIGTEYDADSAGDFLNFIKKNICLPLWLFI